MQNKNVQFRRLGLFVGAGLLLVGTFLLRTTGSDPFMPHGHCYLWNPALLWLHVGSDILIGAAYVAISATLGVMVWSSRRELPFHWIFIAFGIFIVACGSTHFAEAYTVWWPAYWFAGGLKLVTAMASVATAFLLPGLVPKVRVLLDQARRSQAHQIALESEVGERRKAEQALRDANQELAALAQERAEREAREASQRQRAERALEITEADLQQTAESFRALADNIPQLAWMADASGWISWYNQRWFDYTGTTAEEMAGWGWQKVHHPEHVERVTAKWQQRLDAGTAWEDTFPLRGRDGEYRWFLSRAFPIRDAEGRITRWFGTNTDVTEQRNAEQKLRLAKEEAERASRAKDEFLAALSHELRTPLNPARLLASAAENDATLPEPVRADFSRIRDCIETEARLIDDLLDISRIERGKLELATKPLDAHAVLEAALETLRQSDAGSAHRFTVELAARHTCIRADGTRLQQVFWNLLNNAVKFAPPSAEIRVSSRNDHRESTITFEIADEGLGMTADELARAFESFAQGDHALSPSGQHQFGGLGLGLAISKRIVEAHGGRIWAVSAGRGCGATFFVQFPACEAPAPVAPSPAQPRKGAATGLRLLLVEDHEPTREALARLLRRRGHAVTTAGSVAEGLAASEPKPGSRAFEFDVLISDIGLPDGSGHELLSTLRARYGTQIRAIALSGYGMSRDTERSRTAGFAHHLTKPVDFEAVEALLV